MWETRMNEELKRCFPGLAPVMEDRKPHTLRSMSKLFTTFQLRLAGKNSVTSFQNHRVEHLGVYTGFTQTRKFQIVGYIER